MDELASSSINRAHFLRRKAASVVELGNLAAAIELYKQANECLVVAYGKLTLEPILQKSVENQLVENEWQVHIMSLRLKSGDEEDVNESPRSPERRPPIDDNKDDDDIVVIDHFDPMSQSAFLTDSLCPNRTLVLGRQRAFSARSPLMPASDNNNKPGKFPNLTGRKLPKSDKEREEEIREDVKLKQKLARELCSDRRQ